MHTTFRNALGEKLTTGDAVVLFAGKAPKSTADANYTFLPNKNFFYLTGITCENFIILMHKTERAFESHLFIEKPDYDIEKWIGRKMTKETATSISGVESVKYLDEFHDVLNRLIYNNQIQKIYLDLEKLSWDESDSVAHDFSMALQKRYPFIRLKTIHPILSEMRMIKTPEEIAHIREAIQMTDQGLRSILKMLKPDVMEYQIEATFAHAIRMAGADGNSFPTIAASGGDAVILHYVENNKAAKAGDMVLLDLGAQYKQYAADISRTYPVSGRFSERQKTIYNIVLKAQAATIEAMKPGVKFETLNEVCKSTLISELKAIGLIQKDEELTRYYYHGVSHYLGLDVHDLGRRDVILQPGMVLTVEPGLYIAEENIGIRIEDDILITEAGNENLSVMIPKTIDEIEKLMI
ncbi:aminopeptidase P N-terminal domain-containing protein [Fusibacter ferrireducens]|uniref:Xaa-Pro aminopeptidase n=1 Tax=Fusibacter ferrireducens TaxID=2785058 RepID=A0ABR9ZRE0_9FIRM|nr:aminopeptidase P N-terminal domain-containing protein [Fusibacter ferrireducens]MBF4692718.1 aminopeptidase P N-terminal domain-containing protein [Fusibacter ferrireducens]